MLNLHKQIELNTTFDDTTNQVVIETAAGGATGAGSIATFATPLMPSVVTRPKPTTAPEPTEPKKKKSRLSALYHAVAESAPTPGELVASLRAARTQLAYNAEDTTTFGMLDDSDNVVRITVPTEQARGFEMELGRLLSVCADQHESLADVVFALKDKFTIVDLVWPTIPSEQEEVPADSPEAPQDPATGELGNEDVGVDVDSDGENTDDSSSVEQTTSLLQQVLDMMKSDAAARKADADAREAEAHAREAEAVLQQATAVAKHEEEILDMEAEHKAKVAQEKEAKRLAQLNQWKQELDDQPPGEDQ